MGSNYTIKIDFENGCKDGRWSCYLDGAVLAGRSGTGVRAAPGQFTEHRRLEITRPIVIAVHNAINIHSTGIFLPENSGRSARAMPIYAMLTVVAAITIVPPGTRKGLSSVATTKRCSETNAGARRPRRNRKSAAFSQDLTEKKVF